jgi:Uma2 family endonuclease
MATVVSPPTEIDYPSSDGEPMAKTPIHRDVMFDSIAVLKNYYADEPNVYVSGNMMMYYVDGNADKWISPDVFVTLGIPKLPERRIYQTWREGKGPDAVIEVTSTSTARVDQRHKFELYRDVLRVREYILFDPREQTLAGADLCGFRLVKGEYEFIARIGGRLPSDVLGLELEASGEHLRFYDPRRGVYLPTPDEIREALERESAARLAAEADVEVERLRREIEALRRDATPSA